MTMTERALREGKHLSGEANLFNERHVRDDDVKDCTEMDVLIAHRNLVMVNKPWPTKAQALAHIKAVQDELDRMIIFGGD